MVSTDSKKNPEPGSLEALQNEPAFKQLCSKLDQQSPERQRAFMAMLENEKEVFSPDEVAEKLGVTVGTVRRWLRTGELKATKVGRKWFVAKPELERIIQGDK